MGVNLFQNSALFFVNTVVDINHWLEPVHGAVSIVHPAKARVPCVRSSSWGVRKTHGKDSRSMNATDLNRWETAKIWEAIGAAGHHVR